MSSKKRAMEGAGEGAKETKKINGLTSSKVRENIQSGINLLKQMKEGGESTDAIQEEALKMLEILQEQADEAVNSKGNKLPDLNRQTLKSEVNTSINEAVASIEKDMSGTDGEIQSEVIVEKTDDKESVGPETSDVQNPETDMVEEKASKIDDINANIAKRRKEAEERSSFINGLGEAFENPGQIREKKKKEKNKEHKKENKESKPKESAVTEEAKPAQKEVAPKTNEVNKNETEILSREDAESLINERNDNFVINVINGLKYVRDRSVEKKDALEALEDLKNLLADPILAPVYGKGHNGKILGYRKLEESDIADFKRQISEIENRINGNKKESSDKKVEQKKAEKPDVAEKVDEEKAVDAQDIETEADPEGRFLNAEKLQEVRDAGAAYFHNIEKRFHYLRKSDVSVEDKEDTIAELREMLSGPVLISGKYVAEDSKQYGGLRLLNKGEINGLLRDTERAEAKLKEAKTKLEQKGEQKSENEPAQKSEQKTDQKDAPQNKETAPKTKKEKPAKYTDAYVDSLARDYDAELESSIERSGIKIKKDAQEKPQSQKKRRQAIIPNVDMNDLKAYDDLEALIKEAKGDPKKEADLIEQLRKIKIEGSAGSHITATDPTTGKELYINKPAKGIAAPNTLKKMRIENEERGFDEAPTPKNTENAARFASPFSIDTSSGLSTEIPEKIPKPIFVERVSVTSADLFVSKNLPMREFTSVEDALDEPGFAHFLTVLDKKHGGVGIKSSERIEYGDDAFIKEQYKLFVEAQYACVDITNILRDELLSTYEGQIKMTPEIEATIKDYFADMTINDPVAIEMVREEIERSKIFSEAIRDAQYNLDAIMTKIGGGDAGIAKLEQEIKDEWTAREDKNKKAKELADLIDSKSFSVFNLIKKVGKASDLMSSGYIKDAKIGHIISPNKHLNIALKKLQAEIDATDISHAGKVATRSNLMNINKFKSEYEEYFTDSKKLILGSFLPYEVINSAISKQIKESIDESIDSAKNLDQLEKAQEKVEKIVKKSGEKYGEIAGGDFSDSQNKIDGIFKNQVYNEIRDELEKEDSGANKGKDKTPKKPYQRVQEIIYKKLYKSPGVLRKLGSKEGPEVMEIMIDIIKKIAEDKKTSAESRIYLARMARNLSNPFSIKK